MSDLEYQEQIARMTIPEIIEAITMLTEAYNEHLSMLTHEILVRAMQDAE